MGDNTKREMARNADKKMLSKKYGKKEREKMANKK